MGKCYDYKTGQHDSAGNPILGRMCFCGTTACLQNQIQNFGEVQQVFKIETDDCSCKYDLVPQEGGTCQNCKDRRAEAYNKMFKNTI